MRAVNAFRFGDFVLDVRRRRLVCGERVVRLKPKEWALLHYLIEHRERLVEKDELIDALWPRQSITEANLTQTVYRVRQALDDSARNARWIETVSRIGYRFIGEVEPIDEISNSTSLRSVAMVPFSGSDESAPSDWSLGLTECVIRALTDDPDLEVRPLSSVMHVESGRGANARSALRVDAVIEGEISERGDAIRVVAKLLDGRSGTLRWSKAWVVDRSDERGAQDRIARELHDQLGTPPSSGPSGPKQPDFENAEARTAYLRGRYCWHQFTESSLRRSIELFDKALASSPRSAAAYAWRAAGWAALGNIGALTPRESAEKARRDADRAISIDERIAAGFEMRAVVQLYFDWNVEAALQSLEAAIERDAESANAHHLLGNALAFSGSFNAALLSLQHAELIDPTSLITLTDIGIVHYLAGRTEEARNRLEAVLAQNEYFSHARLKLAFVMAALDRPDAALQHAERVQQEAGSKRIPEIAFFQGLAGRLQDARETIEAIDAEAAARDTLDPYSMALAHLGAGANEPALKALARAVEFRSRQLVLMALDPVWQPLHSNSVFGELVSRVGLAPSAGLPENS